MTKLLDPEWEKIENLKLSDHDKMFFVFDSEAQETLVAQLNIRTVKEIEWTVATSKTQSFNINPQLISHYAPFKIQKPYIPKNSDCFQFER